jgi:multidrug resistance efflux pump
MLRAGARLEEIALLEANVAQARSALEGARAILAGIEMQLARMELTAPADGVVVHRLIEPGELASPGAPLLVLADLDRVTLTVYVPQASLGQVNLGQAVEVTVDAYDQVFQGEVSHIASKAEFTPSNVQTEAERVHLVFAVRIRLPNPDEALKPGMPADAIFQDSGGS